MAKKRGKKEAAQQRLNSALPKNMFFLGGILPSLLANNDFFFSNEREVELLTKMKKTNKFEMLGICQT